TRGPTTGPTRARSEGCSAWGASVRRCSDVRNHGGGNSAGRSAASSKHRLTGTIGTPRYGRWCPLLPFSEGGSHALPRLAPRTLVRAVRTCAVRSAGRAALEGPAPRAAPFGFLGGEGTVGRTLEGAGTPAPDPGGWRGREAAN